MSQNDYTLVLFSFVAAYSLFVGLNGVLNKEKINDSSQYYIAIGSLILGILLGIVSLLHLLHMFHRGLLGYMSERQYFYFMMCEMIIVSFTAGVFGLVNKNRINDGIARKFLEQLFVGSIMTAVFLILFWFKWH